MTDGPKAEGFELQETASLEDERDLQVIYLVRDKI